MERLGDDVITLEASDRFIDNICSSVQTVILKYKHHRNVLLMKEMDSVSPRWTCFGLERAHQPKNKTKTSCEDAGWSWRECVIIYRETRSFPGRTITPKGT